MMKFLEIILAENASKDPQALLDVIVEAEAKLREVDKALTEVAKLTSKLPGLFRSKIHAGNVHNLETPKEYAIWVGIENIKSLYGLSREFRETEVGIEHLKKQLKAYK